MNCVYCPQCRVQVLDGQCPRCKLKVEPLSKKKARESRQQKKAESIPFHFATDETGVQKEVLPDRHSQPRNKVNRLAKKKKDSVQSRSKGGASSKPGTLPQSEIKHSLLQYRLAESGEGNESRRRMVTLAKKRAAPPSRMEKPLIRMPVTRRSRPTPRATQKELWLPAPSPGPTQAPAARSEEAGHPARRISREVLFSRFLAGIIDLLIPVLIGLCFAVLASKVLNFEFFAANSLWLILLFSFSFFLFNSFFFLLTGRQTPGMYLADLQLINEESEDISLRSVCLRICLFLPVAMTIVGLVWGFFDPRCRCWHDRLSQTRVVPVQPTNETTDNAQARSGR